MRSVHLPIVFCLAAICSAEGSLNQQHHELKELVGAAVGNKFGSESRASVEAAVLAKNPGLDLSSLSDEALLLEFQQLLNQELAVRAAADPAAALSWYQNIENRLTPTPTGLWPWMDNDDLINANPSARTTTPTPARPAEGVILSGQTSPDDQTAMYHEETVIQIIRPPTKAASEAAVVNLEAAQFQEIARLALAQLDDQAEDGNKGLSEPQQALRAQLEGLVSVTAAAPAGMAWLSEDNLRALMNLKKNLRA